MAALVYATFARTYSPFPLFPLLMLGVGIGMICLGIWIIRRGRKMQRKGKEEEKEKQEK